MICSCGESNPAKFTASRQTMCTECVRKYNAIYRKLKLRKRRMRYVPVARDGDPEDLGQVFASDSAIRKWNLEHPWKVDVPTLALELQRMTETDRGGKVARIKHY